MVRWDVLDPSSLPGSDPVLPLQYSAALGSISGGGGYTFMLVLRHTEEGMKEEGRGIPSIFRIPQA